MSARPSFTIPVGSLSLTVPAGRQEVPGLLWGNLAVASLMLDQGHEDIARNTLEKLQGWLDRSRAEELAFPGEVAQRKGRKLIDGVEAGDEMLSWYVVRSATRSEARAEEGLIEAGFPVYVPRMAYWRRVHGVKHRVERPLLGGYLFVGARSRNQDRDAHDADLTAINGLEYVHKVVSFAFGMAPRPAPFSEIRKILEQEQAGDYDKTIKEKRRFEPVRDQPVRVTTGSFQGFPAKFSEWSDGERVKVLQHMFGRWMTMHYDIDEIEPIT